MLLDRYISLIQEGEIVAFPTETVYGLGADAWNPDAIKKVFEQKGRPADNPLIIHIASKSAVQDFAAEVPETAKKLMEAFWPGPLTLIFKKKPEVLDLITAGLPTVALRWPSHPLSQELISRAGPLVAPSANTSGRPSPTKAQHVREDFGENFPVVDAGETQIGLESTVIDISVNPPRIYRPGYIGKEQIENVLGTEVFEAKEGEGKTAKSPGTKYSHYSPKAEVRWLANNEKPVVNHSLYLFHDRNPEILSDQIIFYKGDLQRFARELYDRFRQADHRGIEQVVIEPFSKQLLNEQALARALENRISKAAAKKK